MFNINLSFNTQVGDDMDKHFLDLNMTTTDCYNRFIVGMTLIGMTLLVESIPTWLALLGTYPILTGIISWDPLYALMLATGNSLASLVKGKQKPLLTN